MRTTNDNSTTLINGGQTGDLVVGAYGGSQVNEITYAGKLILGSESTNNDAFAIKNVDTDQVFNIEHAKAEENVGGMTIGQNAFHEIIESYFGAKDTPGATPPTGYPNAHSKAINADKNYDNSVEYGYNHNSKEYSVSKPIVINGITLKNTQVLYKKK